MVVTKTLFKINSQSVGDMVAAAAVIKWSIDNIFLPNNADYRVLINPSFKEIFHFIPQEKLLSPSDSIPSGFIERRLNMPRPTEKIAALVPGRIKLTEYAAINLLGRILPNYEVKYVPFPKVDIDKYNIDFKNSVVIVVSYVEKQRSILSAEIKKVAEYVYSKGLIPVFVGKTKKDIGNGFYNLDFEYPGFGFNLVDKTTILELATIMSMAKAVIGMDSGPIHIAFTTDTPVICGFTAISPEYRMPYRGTAKTIPVVPNIACNFCESNWQLDTWDFSKCPRQLEVPECTTKMTSDKFIAALKQLRAFC